MANPTHLDYKWGLVQICWLLWKIPFKLLWEPSGIQSHRAPRAPLGTGGREDLAFSVGQGQRGIPVLVRGTGGAAASQDPAECGEGEGMCLQALLSPRLGVFWCFMMEPTTAVPSARAVL